MREHGEPAAFPAEESLTDRMSAAPKSRWLRSSTRGSGPGNDIGDSFVYPLVRFAFRRFRRLLELSHGHHAQHDTSLCQIFVCDALDVGRGHGEFFLKLRLKVSGIVVE